MRKFFLAVILVAALLFPILCSGQYAWYYYPAPGSAPWPYGQPSVVPQPYGPRATFQYRLAPSPRTMWQWNLQNRWQDWEKLQRSPLNPESTLEYMMRTF